MRPASPALAPAELIRLRRELHKDPEVGLDLPRTQARILAALEPLPLEIILGTGCTSITAVLRGGARPDCDVPSVLLRADMDALPVTEETGLEFSSAVPGAMHACGHDLHMAMLIGAAHELSARRESLEGDVVFMFQPGEEGYDGASIMIDEGVLDASGTRAIAAYGLHVFSAGNPPATFLTRPETIMSASDALDVTVLGAGGHGSAPFLAYDPISCAAEMITALQTLVTRRFDIFDPAVISVGMFSAGTAENIIPDTAHFRATVRTFSTEARARMMRLAPELLESIARAHGLRARIQYVDGYPPTVNDPSENDFAEAVVSRLHGTDRLRRLAHPMSASEDFSRVLEAVPGAFIGLSAMVSGADHPAYNHSPTAVFDDDVLADGAAVFVELATARLARTTASEKTASPISPNLCEDTP